MPQRLVVTGASGYIGARLVERARRRGCEVVALGSRPAATDIPSIVWRLGERPSLAAFAGATAVIHLAHDWASDRANGTGPGNANLSGAEALADAAREAGAPRLVFASTTSSRPEALNAYGKIKFAIEERLRALSHGDGCIICARIGLVYGGPERAMCGLMSKLAGLPVLPMIGLDREVQPIHLDEVCDGLLALALDPPTVRQTVVLAGPVPMTFGNWLRVLRRARHGRRLGLIPVPIAFALMACDLSKAIPFVPTVERERVIGLAGAAPMASAADLAGLPPSSFAARMPFGRRAGSEIFRALAPALAMATIYFPGRYSANKASLRYGDDGARIHIHGGITDGFDALAHTMRRRLARIWRKLGAFALPGAALATAGTDAHLGGVFPLGVAAPHGTSRLGELNGAPGLHIVDGAVLPSIPSTFTTLTIMANADRIGRHLAGIG